jgi:hypothetical protein
MLAVLVGLWAGVAAVFVAVALDVSGEYAHLKWFGIAVGLIALATLLLVPRRPSDRRRLS